MIRYNEIGLWTRLIQIKGTAVEHTFVANFVTVLVSILAGELFKHNKENDSAIMDYTSKATEKFLQVHSMMLVPLGFLLVFRTSQAYERYEAGVHLYSKLKTAAGELIRQATVYLAPRADGKGIGYPPGEYTNADANSATTNDLQRSAIVRHCLSFVAAVRQDIRNNRVEQNSEDLTLLRMHLSDGELAEMKDAEVFEQWVNSPLIIARWLGQDLMDISDRLPGVPVLVCMDNNIREMVEAWRGIDSISNHPVPWPYTHLSQMYLVLWCFTLPVSLAPVLASTFAVIFCCTCTSTVLFGIDAVSQELQDPFGFDDNDLNIHGYENAMVTDADTLTCGRLQFSNIDGKETVDVATMLDNTQHLTNELTLTAIPCRQIGVFGEKHLGKLPKQTLKGMSKSDVAGRDMQTIQQERLASRSRSSTDLNNEESSAQTVHNPMSLINEDEEKASNANG